MLHFGGWSCGRQGIGWAHWARRWPIDSIWEFCPLVVNLNFIPKVWFQVGYGASAPKPPYVPQIGPFEGNIPIGVLYSILDQWTRNRYSPRQIWQCKERSKIISAIYAYDCIHHKPFVVHARPSLCLAYPMGLPITNHPGHASTDF